MREDVGGALVAGEQVLAVLGVEEFAERLDAADDQDEIVLAVEREHGIDEIVPRALLAQLDFQAIGKEGKQINARGSLADIQVFDKSGNERYVQLVATEG